MSTHTIDTSLEVIVEENSDGVSLESVKASNKSALNGHKTITIDLNAPTHRDIIVVGVPRAAIDLNTIISLNLSNCNLAYFPDAFGPLNLQQLNLSHNKLVDVPNSIVHGLKFLKTIDLSHNLLEQFEIEPKCVQKLSVLRINGNRLANVPEWILKVRCFNLEELYYSDNTITSMKKSRFRHECPYSLKRLEMKNCLLRSQDVPFLKNVRTLNVLDLSNESKTNRNCFASCNVLEELLDRPLWANRLKILCLNDLGIVFLPEKISSLVELEELYLAKNDFIWLPDWLSHLEKLRVLDMSCNGIASLPKGMSNMKNLKVLRAPHNCISSIPDFSTMSLSVLDLYDNYLDTDCDINVNFAVTQIDLEQNYLDANALKLSNYHEMKGILRLDVQQKMIRKDGTKQEVYDDPDPPSNCSTDSEWECQEDNVQDVVHETFVEVSEEESWNSKPEHCENGCVSVDNEWTGSEQAPIMRRKAARVLNKYPDWMFEDA